LSVPPVHVLRTLFSGWDWLKTIQYNRFAPVTPFPRSVLSESEQLFVEAIESFDGVAVKSEIGAVLMGERLGVTPMAVASLLASSTIVQKLEHGIYMLRGRRLNLDAFRDARFRVQKRNNGAEVVPFDPDRPTTVTINQSGSEKEVERRVVYLPSYLTEHIQGEFSHATGVHRKIMISRGQIRRLAETADQLGIAANETFEVTFDTGERTFEIQKL
jgi:hypothetical protein